MNKVSGKIDFIESHENLSIVKIKAGRFIFTTIIIETEESADYLVIGGDINLLFKETEVMICGVPCPPISLQNRIEGRIEDIMKGKLLSQVSLKTDIGNIKSIITTNAVRQLDLKLGDEVIAMIKTNEIMLQHD